MENELDTQESQNLEADQTAVSNESEKEVETLSAQKKHWKEQAVDPETGKKWKDIAKELRESSKSDKTEKNDEPRKSDDSDLLQKFDKLALKTEGITEEDELELAYKLKEETGKDMEDLLGSKYFKVELENLRESKANVKATSGVKGSGGQTEAKTKPEYWIAKGVPPTREQIPDSKVRRKISRAFFEANQPNNNIKFYND